MRRGSVPAAHSMDTTWFAIDADGFVAAFDTGEAGALPNAAAAGPEGGDFDAWPLELVLVARALAEGTFPDEEDEDLPLPKYPQDVVLVLAPDPEEAPTTYRDAAGRTYSVHDRLGKGWLVLRDAEPRVVASSRAVEPDRLASLAEDAGVARVILADEIAYWREDGGGALFRFANSDYGDPGAYGRETAPIDPLDAASLPAELREKVSALRLDVRFADAAALHLADLLSDDECQTWGDTGLRGEAPDEGGADARAPAARAPATGGRNATLAVAAIALLALVAVLYWLWR